MPLIERGITVSLPYTGGRPFLRRAVESVLGQTHSELTLIVLNDERSPEPWDLLADIKDKRLVRFDLDANRGRYFADAVALSATEDQYFLIQDDRDWSSADRAALLFEVLREENAGAAFSAISEHTAAAARKVSLRACTRAPAPRPVPVPHQVGLYRTRALRAAGGCYGGFRSGYGALVVALTSLTSRLAYLDVPLYHRAAGEEGTEPAGEEGTESAAEGVRARLDILYEAAYRGFCDYVSGRSSLERAAHADVGPGRGERDQSGCSRTPRAVGSPSRPTGHPGQAAGRASPSPPLSSPGGQGGQRRHAVHAARPRGCPGYQRGGTDAARYRRTPGDPRVLPGG